MAELLKLLNKDRDLIAVLDRLSAVSYERKLSAATPWEVSIPLGDLKQELLDVANYVELEIDGTRVFTGKITARSIGPELVTASGYSEEIELERAITPAQYGLVFSNQDLAAVAEELCYDRAVVRIKDKNEWDNFRVDSYRTDQASEPGLVILQKSPGGVYYPDGYIVLRFDSQTIAGFSSWERIRWASDNDAPVSTTMRYRYGSTIGGLTPWSAAVPGVLTDEIGVVPAATTQRYLEVRFDLLTTDTTSDGIGYTPALFAAEVIARTYKLIEPGDAVGLMGETVSGLTADSTSNLAVLQQAVEQLGYEFLVEDGSLRLGEELSNDRTSEFVLYNDQNVSIAALGDTDEDLVNVLTAYGPGTGINRIQLVVQDAASIAAYGRYPGSKEFTQAVNRADLLVRAQEWLDDHKVLRQSYEVTAAFPVGEEPVFSVGDEVKVVDPLSSLVADVRVLGIVRSMSDSGAELRLDLGTPAKSLVDAILDDLNPSRDTRLALAVPVGLRATPASPGITVSVNPYVNSRSAGVEVHMSDSAGFTPSSATVVGRGQATSYVVTGLVTGARYYFKARSYDDRNEYSAFTAEVSTLAGGITADDIGPGSLDLTKFASGLRPIRVGNDLPAIPDPTNVLIGDGFALYDNEGNPVLYLATDTDNDGFADAWKPAVNVTDLEGLITGDHILANSIDTAQLRAGAIKAAQLDAEAVTAPKIAAGAVNADHLAVGSVHASHIVIKDTSNIVPNPDFDDGDEGWEGIDEVLYQGDSGLPAKNAGVILVESGAGSREVFGSKPFPVTEGETYYVSAWVRRGSAVPSAPLQLGVRASSLNQMSATLVRPVTVPTSVPTGWRFYEGYAVIPSGRVLGRLFFTVSRTTPASGGWWVTKVTLRRAADSKLLVDGSIDLTNADKTNGALSVKSSTNQELLRLGNISGKPGVPSGTIFGLWGMYGSGVFIQGVPRVIAMGPVSGYYLGPMLNHANSRAISIITVAQPDDWTGSFSYTVPAGKTVRAVGFLMGYDVMDRANSGGTLWQRYGHSSISAVRTYAQMLVNGSWRALGYVATAGQTITGMRANSSAVISTRDSTILEPQAYIDSYIQLIEIEQK